MMQIMIEIDHVLKVLKVIEDEKIIFEKDLNATYTVDVSETRDITRVETITEELFHCQHP
jgi:hypothetical protein